MFVMLLFRICFLGIEGSEHVCLLYLLRWVMPCSEPKYLKLGCQKAARCVKYGSCPKYRKWRDSWECSFGNQLNAAVSHGSSWSPF